MKGLLHRPIHGAAFGDGTYSLASQPCIEAGLHAVRYFVIEPRAGAVLSTASSKQAALASARHALRLTGPAANDECWEQGLLFPALPIPDTPRTRPVARRRREVFERSEGVCCYCRAPLNLAGTWHVEHQLPKALDGADDGINLVAACAPCNLAKRDRTALEFVVETAKGR